MNMAMGGWGRGWPSLGMAQCRGQGPLPPGKQPAHPPLEHSLSTGEGKEGLLLLWVRHRWGSCPSWVGGPPQIIPPPTLKLHSGGQRPGGWWGRGVCGALRLREGWGGGA